MPDQELAILPGENVIGDGSQSHFRAQLPAELEHKRRFAAADRPADADGEGAIVVISGQGLGPAEKTAGMVKALVGVAGGSVWVIQVCGHRFQL